VVEADQIELFSKNIHIEPIIKNSLTQFEANLDKKKLKLETNFPEQELTAFLDERLFGRIIYNLVDNAIKFTHQGVITIELKKEIINGAGWAVLYVKDTGIGIKKENYGLIFEDFRQVSEGISRQFEGTGLGLTITKKTVKLMGGEISVESTFGKGTIFTVKFPLIEDIQSLSTLNDVKDKAQETEKAGFRLPVVLYVEDDKINRDVMVMFLNKICSVETAESGEVALKMITAKKYDIILLDINLGDSIGGMGVVKSILAVPEYQNIPIIAVTSYSMGNERSEFLNGGCTHFLAKPFRKQEILSLIESILK
jgi:CheY-like chemotaxis protein